MKFPNIARAAAIGFDLEGASAMGSRFRFDPEKALEVLLYITQQCRNKYNVLKVLYFADKSHLEKYGRLICGDRYVAMQYGPVPSWTFDLVRHAAGDPAFLCWAPALEALQVEGYNIIPLRKPEMDKLSRSDTECLDEAIQAFGHMSFGQLMEISHREAAYLAVINEHEDAPEIPLETLVKTVRDGELLWEYLNAD